MSKLTKFFRNPKLFVYDAITKNIKHQENNKDSYTLDQAMDLLKIFEEQYPVSKIYYKNNLVWYVFRYGLWMKLWRKTLNWKNPNIFNTYDVNLNHKKQIELKSSINAKYIDEINDSCDYLFFVNVNSSDRVLYKNKIYHRIIDPVYETLSSVGKVKKVCLLRGSSKLIGEQMINEPEYILPDSIAIDKYHKDLFIPDDFIAAIQKYFDVINLTEEDIFKLFDCYSNLKYIFKKILLAYQPKKVFFMNMGIHMALCESALELGIETMEIQHGAQKANTPIYNDWINFPDDGYKGLPKYFGVWGEVDANHIRKVFKNTVQPVVIGYPWISKYSELSLDERVVIKFKYYRNIYNLLGVITLQNQTCFPKEIYKLITKNTKVGWIIRKHPKWDILKNLDISSLPNVILDADLQQADLLSVLTLVDFNLTRDSTSVYEANYLGVPSFVYGHHGYRMYGNEIDTGIVFSVTDLYAALNDCYGTELLEKILMDYQSLEHKGKLLSNINLLNVL